MPSSIRKTLTTLAAASLLPAFLPGLALASSDGAWDELRADVAKKCLEAAAGSIDAPKVVVDPFGSETFGLALVSGKPKGAEGLVTHICVYDKQTKAVELGSELTEEALKGPAN